MDTRPQWDELLPSLDESRWAWVAGDETPVQGLRKIRREVEDGGT